MASCLHQSPAHQRHVTRQFNKSTEQILQRHVFVTTIKVKLKLPKLPKSIQIYITILINVISQR